MFFSVLVDKCVTVGGRLLNDLVLWEPMAPKPIDTQETNNFMPGSAWSPQLVAQLMHQGPVSDNFSTCKSGLQYGACILGDVYSVNLSSLSSLVTYIRLYYLIAMLVYMS